MNKVSKGRIVYPIVVVLLLAVIAGCFAYLLNLTPADVGLGELPLFGDQTLADLGFADLKVIDLLRTAWAVRMPDESRIVKNGFDEKEERTKAESALADAYISETGVAFSVTYKYSRIAEVPLYYPEARTVFYSDTTLAYILNGALREEVSEDFTEVDAETGYLLKEDLFSVKEVTVSDTGAFRMVLALDTQAAVRDRLPGMLASVFPKTVYLVSTLTLTANETGTVRAIPRELTVNGGSKAVTDTLKTLLAGMIEPDESGKDAFEYVNELAGEYVADVINHLGAVGTAETENGTVIAGTEQYGASGFCKGGIRLITHTAE